VRAEGYRFLTSPSRLSTSPGANLSGAIPLVGITLVELGLIGKNGDDLTWHATFNAVFLAVVHIAMTFGMLAPNVLGFQMHHG
jgi:hypothetical protein